MAVALPLEPSVPHYDVGVALDGVPYTVEVHWNSRDAAWYLTLRDEEGDPIAGMTGRKIVLGIPIGVRSRDSRRPPGRLLAVDLSGRDLDATLDDLGVRVVVYYYTEAEVAEYVAS